MRIRYARRALRDVATILDYIDRRNPRGAQNVKRTLHRAIQLIGENPEIGRLCGEAQARVIPLGRYPYLIYWQVVADEVWLLHVRHAARRPWRNEP